MKRVSGAVTLTRAANLAALNAPVGLLVVEPESASVFAQYTVVLNNSARVQAKFEAAGIPTPVRYPVPLSRQPAYSRWASAGGTPVADELAARVISLPMSADLAEDDRDRVIQCLVEAVAN